MSAAERIPYKRSQFSTRLPKDSLYTLSHFWIAAQGDNEWRVGFTKFAVRMLGEIVESGFEVEPGTPIAVGDIIGWVEGFKAMTDLFGVIDGHFVAGNSTLEESSEKIYKDPYGEGWLYTATGKPDLKSVDVQGYVNFLDETIDRMLGEQSK